MGKHYVFAGNYREFNRICAEIAEKHGPIAALDAYFCNDPDKLRGREFREGDTWWMGTGAIDHPRFSDLMDMKHYMEFRQMPRSRRKGAGG